MWTVSCTCRFGRTTPAPCTTHPRSLVHGAPDGHPPRGHPSPPSRPFLPRFPQRVHMAQRSKHIPPDHEVLRSHQLCYATLSEALGCCCFLRHCMVLARRSAYPYCRPRSGVPASTPPSSTPFHPRRRTNVSLEAPQSHFAGSRVSASPSATGRLGSIQHQHSHHHTTKPQNARSFIGGVAPTTAPHCLNQSVSLNLILCFAVASFRSFFRILRSVSEVPRVHIRAEGVRLTEDAVV